MTTQPPSSSAPGPIPGSAPGFDHFAMRLEHLGKQGVAAIRLALGIGGGAALVLGVILFLWPGHSLGALAVIAGIYFLVSGAIRLGIGVFARGLPGSMRALDIVLGLLLVVGGWIVARDWEASAAVLAILVASVIGIGWIIEGVLAVVESGHAASRGWAIFYGVVSVLGGIAFLAVPGWSTLWLVSLAGAFLVVLGVIGIMRAITFGRVRRA